MSEGHEAAQPLSRTMSRPEAFALRAPEPAQPEYDRPKPRPGLIGTLGGATAVRAILLVLLVAAGVAVSQLLVGGFPSLFFLLPERLQIT